jgi:predicted Zn-ribbon and HTH transcriptional regulator
MNGEPTPKQPSYPGRMQAIVRVLPCAGCGYPFDHELLGKYGCPNCEGEITEKATKQKI